MFEQFTLGIEEEFQIVDPVTRELKSHVSEILDEGKLLLGEKVKPEMIQSMIEVGTGVCANIQEAREDISKLRCIVADLARRKGMRIVAASTSEDRSLCWTLTSSRVLMKNRRPSGPAGAASRAGAPSRSAGACRRTRPRR